MAESSLTDIKNANEVYPVLSKEMMEKVKPYMSFFVEKMDCPFKDEDCEKLKKAFLNEKKNINKNNGNKICPPCVEGNIIRKYMYILINHYKL